MKNNLKKLVISAMLLALGLVLPFLTGQLQQIGNMLLPMHIPVLLCGFICGPWYGLSVGFIMPLMRSML
ncbi:MAG: ECF transporter S component, partial [Ruminiclostridium sp.]|nr:ECF transporter S component [Ruminiclostridium sp.]